MSILWGRSERRAVTYQDVWGSGGDPDALAARVETLPALFAAQRIIVDTVAATPLHAYQVAADGRKRRMDREPDVIRPVHGTSYAWKAQIVASMVQDGNAFGIPTGMTASGWPAGLLWVDPRRVTVDDSGALPEYFLDGRFVPRNLIVHIPWLVPPGKWRGVSPLKAFKIAFETGTLAQSWGRNWFRNDTVPPVHLRNNARTLEREQAAEAKDVYLQAVQGRQPLVTGQDWDVAAIGTPPDEQRFISTLKLSAGQVAAIYGLDPVDVGGEAANSLTYATTEGNERKHANRVGKPWCERIEEALTLQTPPQEYFKFNLDATVRADLKTRMEAHEIALRIGMETGDEARALEDKEPLTPEQKAEWQAQHGQSSRQLSAAELIQKLYLGVGKVVTAGEAREIIRQSGVSLDDRTAAEIFQDIPPLPAGPPAGFTREQQ